MKLGKRILAGALLLAMSLNLAACRNGGNAGGEGQQGGSVQERPVQYDFTDPSLQVISSYGETEFVLADNKTTEYQVVIPANPQKDEVAAAKRLVEHLMTATKAQFPVITDAEYSGGKAIFLGDTKQTAEAGISLAGVVNESVHIVKTVDGNCYLLGTTGTSNHFAVTTFLKNTIGYAMYSNDEVTLVKMDTLKMRDFPGETYEPAIRYRTNASRAVNQGEFGYANYLYQGRWMSPRGGSKTWHNTLDFLPPSMFYNENDPENYHPEWYAAGAVEICHTAHGDPEAYALMVDEMVSVVIEAAKNNPDSSRMTCTMQDSANWCTCDACSEAERKYGAKNSVCILLLNDIMDKVNAYMDEHMNGRRITLFFFSYSVALKAPAKWDEAQNKWVPTAEELYPHEGVGVMCAPISQDFARPVTDEANREYYDLYKQWGDMGFPLALWVYNQNLISYFAPHNTYYTDIANYPVYEECGVMWLYNQGQWDNSGLTAFFHLKECVQAQLAWDSDADVVTYLDDYFAANFKDAAPVMRQFYDDFRLRLTYCTETLDINGWIGTEWLFSAKAFPYGEIVKYLNYIDEAYAAIEPLKKSDPAMYEKVYKRILAESLFPRFYAISLYPGNYTNTELTAMMKQFQKDCETVGFTNHRENLAISGLWNEWGI